MTASMILYAPNVHTGGGAVLLRALLADWPDGKPLAAYLDVRAKTLLPVPAGARVHWVKPSIGSRMKAGWELSRLGKPGDIIFCFHGLPPLLRNRGRIVVFLQNRLYLSDGSASLLSLRPTAVRQEIERRIGRLCRGRVSEYIVQTPSMARDLVRWLGARPDGQPAVWVLPFLADLTTGLSTVPDIAEWDFVYVADGVPHKNHRTLVEAWRLLAEEGLRPSLALTLSVRDGELLREIEQSVAKQDLRITDLGQMAHADVLALYRKSKAMIFPSSAESFGLPLIEAAHAGLPILAPELDYVRDVCTPVQTFDAASPVSIARAVKRFLGVSENPLEIRTPGAFWRQMLSDVEKRRPE
ncbi:glycosyltransferase [Achromobacter insolitus]|uniref:glycosyltransferase n=1 Tax=Achromobacter insolitus TaxID=217204 RepID=UPI002FE2EE07